MTPLKMLECLRDLDRALILATERGVDYEVKVPVERVRDVVEEDVKNKLRPKSQRRRQKR